VWWKGGGRGNQQKENHCVIGRRKGKGKDVRETKTRTGAGGSRAGDRNPSAGDHPRWGRGWK